MFQDIALAGPILLPALAALLLLGVELLAGGRRSQGSFLLCALGALVALLYSGFFLAKGRTGLAFHGTLNVDNTALLISVIVHFSALLAVLLSRSYLAARRDVDAPEYHSLIMVAASGMAMLAAANDLVNVFLGVELMSIPLYVLAAIQRKSVRSVEAGLKYLLLGAFASAFLLFGMGLLYGASGSTLLSALPAEIARLGTDGGLAAFGVVMFLIGVFFKVAAVPFHMWTPDVYEGSPTPVTAFMATATKAAAFGLLLRFAPVIATGMGPEAGSSMLAVIAVLTMFVGNLGALRQQNLKRLLAYSSIAHAGYMLVGVAAIVAEDGGEIALTGSSAIVFYLGAYAAMNLGAFGVAVVLDRGQGKEGVNELKGLCSERPLLAAVMAVFTLALAGVPPTAGFLGKFYVFSCAVQARMYALAVVAVLASVVGLFYYLRLILLMYFTPREEGAEPRMLRTDSFLAVASFASAVLVLWLGVLPGWFVGFVEKTVGG